MRAVLSAVVLAAVLWAGWHWWLPDDERRIRQVLARVAEGVSGDGGGLDALARLAAVQEEFHPDVIVEAGPPFQRLVGRQAIVGAAARVRTTARNFELTFPDVEVLVAEDRQSATAAVTAQATFDEGQGRRLEARELELGFTRSEDRWVISSVALVEPLKRLP
jgi:ketosteroid isomerase-like protein